MIPVIQLRRCLLVVLQGALRDEELVGLQEMVSEKVWECQPRGVIIDVRALEVVDSFVGHLLGTLVSLCSVLGSQVRVVGVRPDLAITWVELGLTTANIRTHRSMDEALDEFDTGE